MSTEGRTDGQMDEPITIVPFYLCRGTKTNLIAELHKINLDIWDHSRNRKAPS